MKTVKLNKVQKSIIETLKANVNGMSINDLSIVLQEEKKVISAEISPLMKEKLIGRKVEEIEGTKTLIYSVIKIGEAGAEIEKPEQTPAEKVLDIIANNPDITDIELENKSGLKTAEIVSITASLIKSGKVIAEKNKVGRLTQNTYTVNANPPKEKKVVAKGEKKAVAEKSKEEFEVPPCKEGDVVKFTNKDGKEQTEKIVKVTFSRAYWYKFVSKDGKVFFKAPALCTLVSGAKASAKPAAEKKEEKKVIAKPVVKKEEKKVITKKPVSKKK
jgi:hypothetical protein